MPPRGNCAEPVLAKDRGFCQQHQLHRFSNRPLHKAETGRERTSILENFSGPDASTELGGGTGFEGTRELRKVMVESPYQEGKYMEVTKNVRGSWSSMLRERGHIDAAQEMAGDRVRSLCEKRIIKLGSRPKWCSGEEAYDVASHPASAGASLMTSGRVPQTTATFIVTHAASIRLTACAVPLPLASSAL